MEQILLAQRGSSKKVGRQLEVSLLGDLPFSDFHICLGISYIRRILTLAFIHSSTAME
jgi:hypothetical protein